MKLFRKSEIEFRPWEAGGWQKVFDAAELRLSKERVYTLVQFLNYSLSVDGDVIEMGVYKGGTAYVLGHFMKEERVSKSYDVSNRGGNRTLYLCDTFSGTPEIYDKTRGDINRMGKYADTSVQYVERKISGCYDRIKCVEGFIPESLMQIPHEIRFCFAHVHLNLYETTRNALLWLKNRMEREGMVVVEDYGILDCKGVRYAVDELTKMGIINCVYIPTGQAIVHYR